MQLSISYTFLQVEKIAEGFQGPLNVNVQVTFPLLTERISETAISVGFAANVSSSPPFFSVIMRGKVLIQGSREEIEKVAEKLKVQPGDPELVQMVTSNLIFEAMLLLREIGVPPVLPLIPAAPQKPSGTEFHPV
ncbi:MAG: hypothetical protein QXT50_04890 [Thermofilum sp.]|uniref:Uncharacterized protein n=1 Tax=Thermofilum pendens TaxID=2269 RepID=A0A7C4H3F3_THEPE